ncbi:HAMP domain-containing protein [Amycolatopsis sp., V23-08]|uniref:HAMP domain-containing protein n=1 Tax=Amycolatopsis heterodermiae TaxID=3110235 RepID=A0ABU5RMH2_9PSEU|nr:HAMP domain-containing protein [Amycolatopsis sp., V23-08]MEA5366729.1 HAMP domain-containing protein [Amycolatopsis sp., V23-08]
MRTRSAKPFSSLVPGARPADRLRERLPEAGFPRGVGVASAAGLVAAFLVACFCALGFGTLPVFDGGAPSVPPGAVAAQRRDAETLAKAVATSATATAHDLRLAAGAPAFDDPDDNHLLNALGAVYPSWRGVALIDGASRALRAAHGEPVALDSLSGVDLGRLTVRPAARPGDVPLVLSAVPLDGARTGQVLVVSTALRLATPSPPRHLRLVTTGGTVLGSTGADVPAEVRPLLDTAGRTPGSGVLTGAVSPGPNPTAPVVAYAPVSTGATAGGLGLAVVTLTWLPADPPPSPWPPVIAAAALLTLAAGGTLLLRRGLVAPIRRLRTDALAVASGDHVARVRQSRLAEVRRTAAALESCHRQLHGNAGAATSAGLPARLPTNLGTAPADHDAPAEVSAHVTTRRSVLAQLPADPGSTPPPTHQNTRVPAAAAKNLRRGVPARLFGNAPSPTHRTTQAPDPAPKTLRRGIPARLLVGLVTVALLGWSAAIFCTLGQQSADVPAALVAEQGLRLDRSADALRSSLTGSLAELRAAARLSNEAQPMVDRLSADPAFRSVYVVDTAGTVQQRAGREPLRDGPPPPGDGLRQHNTSGRVPVVYAYAGLADQHTLVGELDVTRLAAPLQAAGSRVRVVDDGDRTIADTRGYLAFDRLGDPALLAATAAARTGQAPGPTQVTARLFARTGTAASLDWVVVAEQPAGGDGSGREGARAAALVTAVLALLLFGWHELVVVRPLRRVAAAAELVAAGGAAEPGYPQRQDEIGTVASCVELCRLKLHKGQVVEETPEPVLAGSRS